MTDTYVFTGADPRPAPATHRHKERVLSIPNALASERGDSIVSTLDDQLRFSRASTPANCSTAGSIARRPTGTRVLTFALGYGHGVMRYRTASLDDRFRIAGTIESTQRGR